MPRLTPANVLAILDEADLRAAIPNTTGDGYDTARLATAVDVAAGTVEAALRDRYQTPLPAWPAILVEAAARLAHAELVGEASMSDLIRRRARDARRLLSRLASGEDELDPVLVPLRRPQRSRVRLIPPAGRRDWSGLV